MVLRFLLVVGLAMGLGREGIAEEHLCGRIDLVRDEWGIPHVFAETDEGALYGLGYAIAQDRGFQMHYMLRMIQGRSAEVLGDVAKTRPRGETTVIHDRRMRTFGLYRAAQRVAAHLDSHSLALLHAYSQGVNDFFAHGRLHSLYAEVGLVPEPWTPADCIASWWQVGQFFGTDGTRDLIGYRNLSRPGRANPQPRVDDAAAVVQREDVDAEWIARAEQYMREHGYTLAGSQKPVGEMMTYPGGKHGLGHKKIKIHAFSMIARFFEDKLGRKAE